jgi:hypothetical protein
MSIYIMTVGELAKKRGEPVGEFVKKVQALGFDAGSHAKKLTQVDLNSLIPLLDGTNNNVSSRESKAEPLILKNPNVLLIHVANGKKRVLLVDTSFNDLGNLEVKIVDDSLEDTIGEALLEFRKKMGMCMGVN